MSLIAEVELFVSTPEAERVIETCGREAYGSEVGSSKSWIQKRIAGGEEDVLEHASATFKIVCSRVASHEIVRHRLGSYTQMSMRFTEKAVTGLILPPEIKPEDVKEWIVDHQAVVHRYDKWRGKYPRQTARYMLPHSTRTSLYATWNFRTIRHILHMRTGPEVQPETREIFQKVLRICLENWPSVFGDLEKLKRED